MKDFVCSAYVLLLAARLAQSVRVNAAEARRCAANRYVGCMGALRAVVLQPENETAITGTEPGLPRQSLCFDGSIIGAACLKRYRDRTTVMRPRLALGVCVLIAGAGAVESDHPAM